ncbi:hypothetical protein [Streptomyces massasporeus]|uniref:hypothetical protein n=1 Tax=Streptomyces massasporeus TaxID=67324 RepID=UPI0033E19900
MKPRKTVVTGVAAVAAAIVPLAAAPASAASTAYNTRTSDLTASPNAGMDTSCATRSITLASGNYNWDVRIGGDVAAPRPIYLSAGTYTWKVCLQPQNGYYFQYTTLDKAGSEPAASSRFVGVPSSGTYTWGSSLDPKF